MTNELDEYDRIASVLGDDPVFKELVQWGTSQSFLVKWILHGALDAKVDAAEGIHKYGTPPATSYVRRFSAHDVLHYLDHTKARALGVKYWHELLTQIPEARRWL